MTGTNDKRVLVASNRPALAASVAAALNAIGYRAEQAPGTGIEAVRRTAELRPALAVLDVELGAEQNGIQAASVIQDRFNVPVLYLSDGAAQPPDYTAPFAVIGHPFDRRELEHAIAFATFKRDMERRLADERARRQVAEQTARLQDITAAFSRAATWQEIGEVALALGSDALGAMASALTVLLDNGRELEFVAATGLDAPAIARQPRIPLSQDTGVTESLRLKQPLFFESADENEKRYPGIAPGAVFAAGSRISLPLLIGDRAVGALDFSFSEWRTFSVPERAFVQALGTQCAWALERARLYDQLQLAYARATFLAEAGRVLGALKESSGDSVGALDRVARLAVPAVADWCVMWLIDPHTDERKQVAVQHRDPARVRRVMELQQKFPPTRNSPTNPLRTGKPYLYEEVTIDMIPPEQNDADSVRLLDELGLRSAIAVPIAMRGKIWGSISFVTAESRRRYTPHDLAMAEKLARLVAIALDDERMYREAMEAARAREELLQVVSHDLRNPLSAVLLKAAQITRLLRNAEGADNARILRSAEGIAEASKQMRHLIDDLTDLSRIDTGNRLHVDVRPGEAVELARTAIEAHRPLAAARNVNLMADLPDERIPLACDGERVQQVFANLIGNAVKFSQDGGTIVVRAAKSDSEAVFSIADNGPGISPEHRRLLFNRYWQAKLMKEGLGLGLYVAKGIVEAHGGRMWLQTETGVGNTFHFSLPLSYQGAAEPPGGQVGEQDGPTEL